MTVANDSAVGGWHTLADWLISPAIKEDFMSLVLFRSFKLYKTFNALFVRGSDVCLHKIHYLLYCRPHDKS